MEYKKGDIVIITSQRDERAKGRKYHGIPEGKPATIIMTPDEDVDCQGAYDLLSEFCPIPQLVFPRHFKLKK
jgi:hypothetical protein